MKTSEYYFDFARKMETQRRYELARLFFERSIAINPQSAVALNGYAQNLRLYGKNYVAAISAYSEVIHIDPGFEFVYFRRGICKGALKDFNGQYIDITHHLRISNPEAFDYISRALVSMRLGNFDLVIEDCRTALSIDKKVYGAERLMASAESAIRSKIFSSSYT